VSGVHQFVPTFEPGAVGAHVVEVRRVLRAAGYESEIFAAEVAAPYAGLGARAVAEYGRRFPARRGDRLVYHLAIGSHVAEVVRARRETLVVDYHNLTPLRFLDGWEPVAAGGVAWGRRQLASLAARAALGIGDSRYNEQELAAAGYARTTVVPILVPPATAGDPPDADLLGRLRATGTGVTTWLFVGRVAPNKAQHDVVKAFTAYRRFHDPAARLFLVGGPAEGAYPLALGRFVERLGESGAVRLTGPVSEAAKRAYYEAADVFVSCSEHEGFCVPLLEAWQHGVPVVAYSAAAVPETLGDAGLLLTEKDPCTVAAAVARVATDAALRSALVDAGRRRLTAFDIERTGAAFVAAIETTGDG
jgi:glycosyltransferase involved in cell wall biosynthesis